MPGIPPKIPPAREDAAGFCPSPVCAQCGGAVEVGGLADAVDFLQQGVDLVLEGVTLGLGVGAVGGLGGQLHHTVEHRVDGIEEMEAKWARALGPDSK